MVDELDRILDRDDVARAALVDPADHRGRGRALARPRRTRHDHEPLRRAGPGQTDLGKTELVVVRRLGDRAEDVGRAAALAERAAAEATRTGVVGEVRGALLLEDRLLQVGGQDCRPDVQEVVARDRAVAVQLVELALDAHTRTAAGLHVKVGRSERDRLCQSRIEVERNLGLVVTYDVEPTRIHGYSIDPISGYVNQPSGAT